MGCTPADSSERSYASNSQSRDGLAQLPSTQVFQTHDTTPKPKRNPVNCVVGDFDWGRGDGLEETNFGNYCSHFHDTRYVKPGSLEIPSVGEHRFMFDIQDVYRDGTCPRVQRHISRVDDDIFVRDSQALFELPGNLQTRFIIVCAHVYKGVEYPIHPYVFALLKLNFIDITTQECWLLIERSPTLPSFLRRRSELYEPRRLRFSHAGLRCHVSSRLYDLGDAHLLHCLFDPSIEPGTFRCHAIGSISKHIFVFAMHACYINPIVDLQHSDVP